MKQAITTTTTNALTASGETLTAAALADFIKWIDRGEATTKTYINNLRQFYAWALYTETPAPTREDIIAYRDWLSAEHEAIQLDPGSRSGWAYRTDRNGHRIKVTCKPNTVRLYLRSVCQFYAWAAATGRAPANITENIHAPKLDTTSHKKEHFTPAQVLTIEKSITTNAQRKTEAAHFTIRDRAGRVQRSTEQGKRLFAMYQLAVNCGLRTIELHRANVRDLQVRDGRAVLYVWGKGHSEPDQRKAVAPEVYDAIREYLDSRSDHPTGASPLFVSTGNRSAGKRIAVTTISKMLKAAMVEAGYNSERLTAHSLRHSAGTTMQSITGDLRETQKYMRHSSPTTTTIYLHDSENEEQKAQGLAQQLYNTYHGNTANSGAEQLEQLAQRLTPEQLEQLAGIAKAMIH